MLTENQERYSFRHGIYGSNTAMAPRSVVYGEDDGYLITLITDMNADVS